MNKAAFWTLPALALAACGGAETENKGKAARAAALEAGQYEVTAEVTSFRKADEGEPKIKAEQGARTTRSVCVADGASMPPDLFADEGFECRNTGQPYVSGGTINANVACRGAGLPGEVGLTVSGTFEADSFEAERQLTSSFTTDGDVVIGSTLRGRRTGECAAAPAGGNTAKGAGK